MKATLNIPAPVLSTTGEGLSDEEQRQLKSAEDWAHDDDPDNPHNWSPRKQAYNSLIPMNFSFLCTFSSSVYTPGVDAVMAEFHISREVALFPFVFYLLGFVFGPVIAAPMSETYGRKFVYLTAVPISGLFTLGAGFSQNIYALTFCRFFSGLLSSPGLAIGSATVADIWPPHKRGLPVAAYQALAQMGPALGPLIGGFVVAHKGWRWTQWTILFLLAALLTLTIGSSETYKKAILKRRAKKLGIRGPPEPARTRFEIAMTFVRTTILRPLHMLFTELTVACFDLYIAMNFGLLYGFFAAFPWVFEKVYGFDIVSVGLTFIGQAVGTIIGTCIAVAYDRYYYQPTAARLRAKQPKAKLPPEHRLFICMPAGIMFPATLFWFAWATRPSVHWISPVAAEAVFSAGNIMLFTGSVLYLTDCYGARYGASAMSSNTFSRYLFSMCFPLFIVQMYERLGVGWATSLLAFLMAALAPIPFLFWRYGPRLRERSRYNPEE